MSEFKDVATLQMLLQNLVIHATDVSVQRKEDDMGVLLQVKVNSQDMGIVIGRSGIMAQSIKTIMRAVGKIEGINIRIQFLEPDGSLKYSNPNSEDSKNSNPSTSNDSTSLDSDLAEFVIES